MKPQSITVFDKLFVGSIILTIINSIVFFDNAIELLESDPATATVGNSVEILIGTVVFSIAITLVLWAFVSLRRSQVAKWMLTVMTILGAVALPGSLATAGGIQMLLILAITGMQLAAVGCLFTSSSKDWFEQRPGPKVDAATFE